MHFPFTVYNTSPDSDTLGQGCHQPSICFARAMNCFRNLFNPPNAALEASNYKSKSSSTLSLEPFNLINLPREAVHEHRRHPPGAEDSTLCSVDLS